MASGLAGFTTELGAHEEVVIVFIYDSLTHSTFYYFKRGIFICLCQNPSSYVDRFLSKIAFVFICHELSSN